MPILPEERVEVIREVPFRPMREKTELTGARHNGCEAVAEREVVAVPVRDGVIVLVAEGVSPAVTVEEPEGVLMMSVAGRHGIAMPNAKPDSLKEGRPPEPQQRTVPNADKAQAAKPPPTATAT